ncbi:MAG: flavin reductase family protein [Candidatus Sericytochromatia bacterium]
MKKIDPKNTPVSEIQRLLQGGIAPRPIALVSTISKDGKHNLSPFSFFNVFGANPPIVGFSAARRRDKSLKDTYNNISETKECVIQVVTYNMVEQVSLSSTEYETGIDEFIKSGLTPIDSVNVKAKRVKESPFQMECKLHQIINLGDGAGAGNLVLCEVILFHVAEDIFKDGIIYPDFIDLVGRNSGDFYTRAKGSAIFEVEKPINKKGIGYDNLPSFIKESHLFSANNLAKFANIEKIPSKENVYEFIKNIELKETSEEIFYRASERNDYQEMLKSGLFLYKNNPKKNKYLLELTSKKALELNDSIFAWNVILYINE